MNSAKDPDKLLKWTAVYLGAVSCLLVPLFIRNSYFGLIELKARVYLYAAVPAVVLMAVPVLHGLLAGGKKYRKTIILLIAIGVWALFSSLVSLNPGLSFLGSKGWSVGSLMTLVLIAGTIIVSRYLEFDPRLLIPVMIANTIINILAIVQSAGFNVFGLQNGLIREQYYTYLSTIGNANSYSGYLCLVLPLFWGAFMSCGEWSTKVLQRQHRCRGRSLPSLHAALRVRLRAVPEEICDPAVPTWSLPSVCEVLSVIRGQKSDV